MPRRAQLTHMKVVRLRQDEYEIIESMAKKYDVSESELIRKAIRVGLPILARRQSPNNLLIA